MLNRFAQHSACSLPALLIALNVVAPAEAISMRHDVAEQNYLDLAAPYDAVGRISGGGTFASGTLVSDTKFLTAAHFIDGDKDGFADAGLNYTIKFGTDANSPTYTLSSINFSSIAIHPDWSSSGGSSTYDMAVLTLSSAFTNIAPILLSDQDIAVGTTATMVGYGVHGTGTNFTDDFDRLRRAATNTIDVVGSTIRTDFDSPALNTNYYTSGSATPLALEGTTAGGDSGGPLLVDFGDGDRLVGTLRGGFNTFGGLSEYGDVSIWTPVNTESNIAFLQSQGIAVPEPGSLAVLLGGVAMLIRRRRG